MENKLLRVGYYQQIVPAESGVAPDFSVNIDSLSDVSDGLMPGDYLGGPIQGTFAIDYTGFDRWRKLLSLAALNYDAETIWTNPEVFMGEPFYEIIHCERKSVFGPNTCSKLSNDFSEGEEKIEKYLSEVASNDEAQRFMEIYQLFKKAFHTAKDSGCTIFF